MKRVCVEIADEVSGGAPLDQVLRGLAHKRSSIEQWHAFETGDAERKSVEAVACRVAGVTCVTLLASTDPQRYVLASLGEGAWCHEPEQEPLLLKCPKDAPSCMPHLNLIGLEGHGALEAFWGPDGMFASFATGRISGLLAPVGNRHILAWSLALILGEMDLQVSDEFHRYPSDKSEVLIAAHTSADIGHLTSELDGDFV